MAGQFQPQHENHWKVGWKTLTILLSWRRLPISKFPKSWSDKASVRCLGTVLIHGGTDLDQAWLLPILTFTPSVGGCPVVSGTYGHSQQNFWALRVARKLSQWLGLVLGHPTDTQLDWSWVRQMPWALCHIPQTISCAVFAVYQGVLLCCGNHCHQGVPLPIKGCTYRIDVWLGCAHAM